MPFVFVFFLVNFQSHLLDFLVFLVDEPFEFAWMVFKVSVLLCEFCEWFEELLVVKKCLIELLEGLLFSGCQFVDTFLKKSDLFLKWFFVCQQFVLLSGKFLFQQTIRGSQLLNKLSKPCQFFFETEDLVLTLVISPLELGDFRGNAVGLFEVCLFELVLWVLAELKAVAFFVQKWGQLVDLVLGLLLKGKKFKFHSLKLIFCSHLALAKPLLIKLTLFVSDRSNGPEIIIFPEQLPLKLGLHKAHLMLVMLFKLKQVGHELINLDFERAILLMRAIKFFLGGLTGLNENVDIRLNFVDFERL